MEGQYGAYSNDGWRSNTDAKNRVADARTSFASREATSATSLPSSPNERRVSRNVSVTSARATLRATLGGGLAQRGRLREELRCDRDERVQVRAHVFSRGFK